MKLTRSEIERMLPLCGPAFIENAQGEWCLAENATVKAWREQKCIADLDPDRTRTHQRVIGRMVTLADLLAIPEDTPLLAHIQAPLAVPDNEKGAPR